MRPVQLMGDPAVWQNEPMSSTIHGHSPVDDVVPPPKTTMPRVLVILLGLAALVVAAQGLQSIRSIVAASFLALNVVIVVWPVQRALAKFLPRIVAAIAAGLVAFGVLGALIWSMGWTIARLIQELPKYSSQYSGFINQINEWAARYNITDNDIIDTALRQLSSVNITTVVGALREVISGLTNIIGLIVIVLIVLFFMIFDSAGFSERLQRVGDRHNPAVAWALSSFARGTRRYWVVTTVIGLIIATFNWVYLLWLGIPLALIWAVFSFAMNYVPYIGFILSLIPPVIMALLANDPLTALWVLVGFYVFNTLIMTFVQPRLAGNAVGITPTVAFLSLLLWSYILGPIGTILAIPATLFVKTLFIDIDPNTRWLNAFIASNPKTSDQDPIRLSALLARAKRIRTLSARAKRRGASAKQAEAANLELSTLAAEEDAE